MSGCGCCGQRPGLIVSNDGEAMVCAECALDLSAVPAKPRRTLRNEIARGLMEAHDWRLDQMRYCLEDAGVAVEALRNFVLVFGPEALIEAL